MEYLHHEEALASKSESRNPKWIRVRLRRSFKEEVEHDPTGFADGIE